MPSRCQTGIHPVLQKIQAGEEITDEEIDELARLLEAQALHVTEDVLRKVYDHKTAKFIQFIRHILGLEKLQSWTETARVVYWRSGWSGWPGRT